MPASYRPRPPGSTGLRPDPKLGLQPQGFGLLLLRSRRQPGFQLSYLFLQGFEPGAGARQHDHLAVEFFTADQVQFAEGALHQHLELAFQFGARLGGIAAEQARGLVAQGVEKGFGREHVGLSTDTEKWLAV